MSKRSRGCIGLGPSLAAIDAGGGLLPWNPDVNGAVLALAPRETTVLIGGEFSAVGGTSRLFLAAIETNGDLGSWAPRADSTVLSLLVAGSTVYAGGQFSSIAGRWQPRFAPIDATSGALK